MATLPTGGTFLDLAGQQVSAFDSLSPGEQSKRYWSAALDSGQWVRVSANGGGVDPDDDGSSIDGNGIVTANGKQWGLAIGLYPPVSHGISGLLSSAADTVAQVASDVVNDPVGAAEAALVVVAAAPLAPFALAAAEVGGTVAVATGNTDNVASTFADIATHPAEYGHAAFDAELAVAGQLPGVGGLAKQVAAAEKTIRPDKSTPTAALAAQNAAAQSPSSQTGPGPGGSVTIGPRGLLSQVWGELVFAVTGHYPADWSTEP